MRYLVLLLFTLVCHYVHAQNQKALSLDGDGDYLQFPEGVWFDGDLTIRSLGLRSEACSLVPTH